MLAAMVEGQSRPAARDGRQLLAQAVLWRQLFLRTASLMHIEGKQGAEKASQLKLEPLLEVSSDVERWWGDGKAWVVEIERGNGYPHPMTYVVS